MKTSINIIPRLILLGTAVFGVLVLVNYVLGYSPSMANLWSMFAFTQLYTFCLYYANALFFRFLDTKFVEKFSVKRIVSGFAGSFVISLAVVFGLRVFEDMVVRGVSFDDFIAAENPSNYVFAIVVTFFVTLSLYAASFYKSYQENRVNEQKIIAGRASAQLESLKSQIDPHFLFNSLNVLSSLIEENPKQARSFTISLSKVYRYVLEQKDKELVSLSEELEFARVYMKLLQMRFENGLEFHINVPEEYSDYKVVPLSLQLLLENAIKHNVVTDKSPLRVEIIADGDQLVVFNNLQRKDSLSGERKGLGLENIASRYALLTNRKVRVEELATSFAIHLPLLSRQVEIADEVTSDEAHAYGHARKKVEELREFYASLISYFVVNLALAILNYATSPSYLWFLWVAGSWGFGLIFQGVKALDLLPFMSGDWEERRIRKILEKEENEKTKKWK